MLFCFEIPKARERERESSLERDKCIQRWDPDLSRQQKVCEQKNPEKPEFLLQED